MKSSEPSVVITEVVHNLSLATSLDEVMRVVAQAARELTGADGATFVLRDEERCYYADENAISPLWKGSRFPLEACISGWSMLNRSTVLIRDIYKDSRIPHDAYRPTFVKSLCMVPIREANPIGAIGNYWKSEHTPTNEEIKLLQMLANSSAIALENIELKQSIRRRNNEKQSLADRQKDLENAIHTLAHDLRSPISTMMGCAEVLQIFGKDVLDDHLKGYLNSIIKTGLQANEQIKKMLTLYSATHRTLDKEPVDMAPLCLDIFEQLKSQCQKRKIECDIQKDLTVMADPVLLRLALENLLSNAVKYTAKKDRATIFIRKAPEPSLGQPTFFVRDNGDGFDPGDAEKLFRPLVRLHQDPEFSGTGLGLASVARIIELHGGRVKAEGQKDVGATFYFSLPSAG